MVAGQIGPLRSITSLRYQSEFDQHSMVCMRKVLTAQWAANLDLVGKSKRAMVTGLHADMSSILMDHRYRELALQFLDHIDQFLHHIDHKAGCPSHASLKDNKP